MVRYQSACINAALSHDFAHRTSVFSPSKMSHVEQPGVDYRDVLEVVGVFFFACVLNRHVLFDDSFSKQLKQHDYLQHDYSNFLKWGKFSPHQFPTKCFCVKSRLFPP